MAEALWNGRFTLAQREGVFPLSMDTMALADFISLRPGDRVWDLGCGSGPLALLLAGRDISFTYTGVDASPAACALAAENLSSNGLHGAILQRDIAALTRIPPGTADLVISNPPYFPPNRRTPGSGARTGLSLENLCASAAQLLGHGGRFALIYPAQRLPDLFDALRSHHLEPKTMALLAHRVDTAPKLALLEAKKNARPQLEVRPTVVLYDSCGTPTKAYQQIYHS